MHNVLRPTDEEALVALEKACKEMGMNFRHADSPEEAGFYYYENGVRKKMSEEEIRDAIFGPITPNRHNKKKNGDVK